MKSTGARRLARSTLGATRPWIAAGCATAQWKARSVRRYPPPLELLRASKPSPLDQRLRAKHHRMDPRKQTPGGRHQIGIPAGFKSESVAGFLSEWPGYLRRNPQAVPPADVTHSIDFMEKGAKRRVVFVSGRPTIIGRTQSGSFLDTGDG